MFYDDQWSTAAELEFWSDALDTSMGAYFQGAWIYQAFEGPHLALAENSINWRELYAVVTAIATWADRLSGKRVIIHCDNSSIVQIINKGSSRNANIMQLVRILFFYVCSVQCGVQGLSTEANEIADVISRGQWERFRVLAPNADHASTAIKPFITHYLI